ncbi:forkhead box protein E3-like [Pyrgilauda ruficollis]|uniref:forkhead box protein E3-like n=1 Tax=Pyrgilauda ruficollis TaxID=221976 RepID=UPI001B86DD90|nr:forkhead box protein E3-like [Pyrgilauda ruficollis]
MAETEPGERRAAPGTGPGTERGTECITGPGTGPGTECITGPGTERITEPGTERITGPGTGPGTERITEPGTGPGTERITEPGTAGWPQRPPYSFVALITMAIRASPGQRLPLSGIYAYIAERFPFYRGPGRQWQNSVRHNLSLNPCFRRLPCRRGRPGEWALDPAFQDMFPEGNYLRRRRRLCRRPSASPAPPSEPGQGSGRCRIAAGLLRVTETRPESCGQRRALRDAAPAPLLPAPRGAHRASALLPPFGSGEIAVFEPPDSLRRSCSTEQYRRPPALKGLFLEQPNIIRLAGKD